MQDTIVNTLAVSDGIAGTIADTLASAAEAARWKYTGIESITQGDGIMISIVGVIIVFVSLTIITLLIRALKIVTHAKTRSKDDVPPVPVKNGVSGEVVAAIALALQTHLFELHDEERTIITIKRVSRTYSPWSSKLYGLRPFPLKHITNR
jgi:glutaconyl-CoA/methylmalonyl-CoA decarboxylase subunit delta